MIVSNKKLILYELNEVPIKLIKLYSEVRPKSNISKLFNNGNILKTVTHDVGELHPWSTWPTVHRGVTNEKHKINFINQDLRSAKEWPPIWEKLANKNITIGIFGSLQSFPPFRNKNTKFYLPDTFSPSSDAYPKNLEIFQSFNLNIVNNNKALTRKFTIKDIINFFKLIFYKNIKINSILQILKHLIQELIYKKYQKRRSLMQAVLSFDVYEKYLNQDLPRFSTFFTNHVAGMMHRYWNDLFNYDLITKDSLFNSNSIIEAMDIADLHIGKLIKISNKNKYDLIILSSMGQEAKDWGNYVPELYIGSIKKLIKVLNLDSRKYKLLPAMQPDLCIKCHDEKSKHDLEKNITRIKSFKGRSLLPVRYKNDGLNLNISIQKSLSTVQNKFILLDNKKVSLKSIGIEIIKRDKGTGYHIKQGMLMYKGSNLEKLFKNKNKVIETNKIHNMILKFFNLS